MSERINIAINECMTIYKNEKKRIIKMIIENRLNNLLNRNLMQAPNDYLRNKNIFMNKLNTKNKRIENSAQMKNTKRKNWNYKMKKRYY